MAACAAWARESSSIEIPRRAMDFVAIVTIVYDSAWFD
jgi:hypothetical protein